MLALGEELVCGYTEWVRTDAHRVELAQNAAMNVLPWAAERERNVERLRAGADDFGPRAEAWLADLATHPWERPDLGHQVWVGGRGVGDPSEEHFEPPSGYRGMAFYGPRGGFWTTTATEGWPLQWFLAVAFMRATEIRIWELDARPGARVFQVRSEADWVELVRRYPSLAEPGPVCEAHNCAIPGPLLCPSGRRSRVSGTRSAGRCRGSCAPSWCRGRCTTATRS